MTYYPRYFKMGEFTPGQTVFYYKGRGKFAEGVIMQTEHVEIGHNGEGIVRYGFDYEGRTYGWKRVCERFVTSIENKEALIKEITEEIKKYGEPDLINDWKKPQ